MVLLAVSTNRSLLASREQNEEITKASEDNRRVLNLDHK
jgi:hypothetical protein